MNEHRLQWLRPDEVLAIQASKSIIYLPIGPIEWHGPHLPLGTDPLHAESLALALADRLGGAVYPTLYWGAERERSPETLRYLGFQGNEWIVGMDFPANSVPSLYSSEEQFAVVVRWTLEGLVAQGWKMIVIVNGHGATNQIYQLQRLASEFTARGTVRVVYGFGLDAGLDDDAGHATITETATAMALDETRVDLSMLPPVPQPLRNIEWAIVDRSTFSGEPTPDHSVHPQADPRKATPALGHHHLAITVERLAQTVSEAWANIEEVK